MADAARVRTLETLLDRAGQHKGATMQREAEARGQQITLDRVKTELDNMFETRAGDANAELRGLAPDWNRGRPSGPSWREFAEEFKFLAALAPEVCQDDQRELIMDSLPQQLASAVMTEERR